MVFLIIRLLTIKSKPSGDRVEEKDLANLNIQSNFKPVLLVTDFLFHLVGCKLLSALISSLAQYLPFVKFCEKSNLLTKYNFIHSTIRQLDNEVHQYKGEY